MTPSDGASIASRTLLGLIQGDSRRADGRDRTRTAHSTHVRLELEAVVGAVVELGDRLGVPMPATRAVYACAKMLDEKKQRVA